jgi:hypothetical protein
MDQRRWNCWWLGAAYLILSAITCTAAPLALSSTNGTAANLTVNADGFHGGSTAITVPSGSTSLDNGAITTDGLGDMQIGAGGGSTLPLILLAVSQPDLVLSNLTTRADLSVSTGSPVDEMYIQFPPFYGGNLGLTIGTNYIKVRHIVGGLSGFSGTLVGTNVIADLGFGVTNYYLWTLTNADNWIDASNFTSFTGWSPNKLTIEFHSTNNTYQVHFSTNFVFGTDITGTNWVISTNTMFGGYIGPFPGQPANGIRVVSMARGYAF